MIHILTEDIPNFTLAIERVISVLSNGMAKAETGVELGDTVVIANIKGYWVGDMIRLDIKFRS